MVSISSAIKADKSLNKTCFVEDMQTNSNDIGKNINESFYCNVIENHISTRTSNKQFESITNQSYVKTATEKTNCVLY